MELKKVDEQSKALREEALCKEAKTCRKLKGVKNCLKCTDPGMRCCLIQRAMFDLNASPQLKSLLNIK
jgi:hypothetical protein